MDYKCVSCGKRYPGGQRYFCTCGEPLDVIFDIPAVSKSQLRRRQFNHWRYKEFYPVRCRVSMGEGGTRLVQADALMKSLGVKSLHLKDETCNPTGSFKDRGTTVEVSRALEMGAESVVVASTGNMGASCSAYSALGGIRCTVLTPKEISHSVRVQIGVYGTRLIEVEGTYDECAQLAREVSERHGLFLLGDYGFRKEGQKSVAFEMLDQLDFESPDWIILPVGNGTLCSGVWKGIKEFFDVGLIKSKPRLVGVEAKGAAPLVSGKRVRPKTIAHSIAVGEPTEGTSVLKAIKESRGMLKTASDEQMLGAQKYLAKKEGIFVQPGSATVVAILHQLLEEGIIGGKDSVVAVLTGHGLKHPEPVRVRASFVVENRKELEDIFER